MRLRIRPETPFEALAAAANRLPLAAAESLWGMATAGVLIAAVRLGVLEDLARGRHSADELARARGLAPEPTRLLLECLVAMGHVKQRGERYSLSRRAGRWLDPRSKTYVGGFIAGQNDYWRWWSGLEEVVRSGTSFATHSYSPGHPYWESYMTGQYELARLSAQEVARAIELPSGARTLLDVAGGHGWFAAELCARNPALRATVVDLPGSVAVGRRIIADAGLTDRVGFRSGNVLEVDLGGPYDGALCFNLIHHLMPDEIVRLLRRVRAVLRTDGALAVLDLFRRPPDEPPDSSSFLGLFFYLQSSTDTYTPEQLQRWLGEAGFGSMRKVPIRSIPAQTLYETAAL